MDYSMNCLFEALREIVANFSTNVWKTFPFRSGNRSWMLAVLMAYCCCLLCCFLLACVLNSLEGQLWMDNTVRGRPDGPKAKGETALDECIWFFFTTMHGVGFGEFMPHGATGRVLALFACSMGYWIPIFMLSIIMLSQLPGEKVPTLTSAAVRVFSAVWPSYSVFLALVCFVGASVGPYVSKDPYGPNQWATGIYYMWCVGHRMPYGDIYPSTTYARLVTVPAAIIGLLYMPYALAIVAVRCPTQEQHESLLGYLRGRPEDALGRGYIVPKDTVREFSGIDDKQDFSALKGAAENGLP